MLQNTKAFQENLSILFDELLLAKKWNKTSILIAVHKTTVSQKKTKRALQEKLAKIGCSIVDLELNITGAGFVASMVQQKNRENTVFFISNLDLGGGDDGKDAYRVLNLQRETFVDLQLKVVLFLTPHEASNLSAYAPDFWAFRHHAIEFRNPRTSVQVRYPAGLMLWHISSQALSSTSELRDKIVNLRNVLSELPDRAESIALRADLQYELGFAHWLLGNYSGAKDSFVEGISLAKTYDLPNARKKLQNGLAILFYELGNYQYALKLLQNLIEQNPQDCLLRMNQGIVLFAMKQRHNAILIGKRATKLCAKSPKIWNTLGFLYYFAGNMDDAAACFKKAIASSPKAGFLYESLAVCYLKMGLQGEAMVQINTALRNTSERRIFQEALKKCIAGNIDDSLSLLAKAIEAGAITKFDVLRDPNINAVLDTKKIINVKLRRP